MTVVDSSIDLQLIALDHVYGGSRRSLLGSRPNRFVLTIISLHLILSIFLASHLNLWLDEAYSLATTDHNLATTFKWAIGFEEQAPFYFILLWFTRHIHDNLFMARLPSILAAAGTLWISSRISSHLFPLIHRAWIVLALAFNPFLIAIALEARGYAWAVLLSTALFWLFLKGYATTLLDSRPSSLITRPLIPQQNQAWARWAYGFTAVAGLYSHYFLAFQLLAQGLVLLLIAVGSIERRKRAISSLANYCADSIIIATLSLPLILFVTQQLTALQDNSVMGENLSAITAINLLDLKIAIGKTFFRNLVYLLPSNPAGTPDWQWKLARLSIGAWLLSLAWGRRRQWRFNVTLAWLIHGIVMVQLFSAFVLFPMVEYRHAIVMLGLAYFSALGLISLLPQTRRRLLLSLSLILLLCLNGRSLYQVYSPMAKPGDYARVGEYLHQVVSPLEPVLVFNGEVAMALEHYYPGQSGSRQSGPRKFEPDQPGATSSDLSPGKSSSALPAQAQNSQLAGEQAINNASRNPGPALIPLPRSLFNQQSDAIPQYRQDNLILSSSDQITQALAQMPQMPLLEELPEVLQQAPPKGLPVQPLQVQSKTEPGEQLTPLQIELETNLRQANLSATTKAELREALGLPNPGSAKTSQPGQPKAQRQDLNTELQELPQRFWLVRDDQILTAMASFDHSYQLLDDFLAKNYQLVAMQQFHGTQVQQWERHPTKLATIDES